MSSSLSSKDNNISNSVTTNAVTTMAEMTTYAIDLRSITQSRGSFSFHFVRYEEAPPAAQQKAIDDAKAIQEEG